MYHSPTYTVAGVIDIPSPPHTTTAHSSSATGVVWYICQCLSYVTIKSGISWFSRYHKYQNYRYIWTLTISQLISEHILTQLVIRLCSGVEHLIINNASHHVNLFIHFHQILPQTYELSIFCLSLSHLLDLLIRRNADLKKEKKEKKKNIYLWLNRNCTA